MNSLTNKNQNIKNSSSATITQETIFNFNQRDASYELNVYDFGDEGELSKITGAKKFDAPNGETYWFCDECIYSKDYDDEIEYLRWHSENHPTAEKIWALMLSEEMVPSTKEGVAEFNSWYRRYKS